MKKKTQHRFKYMFVLFILSLGSYSVEAQDTSVTGTIIATDGMPVPGVNIVQKGTTNGVVSDFDGNYAINLREGSDILVFSYIGYQTMEESVGERKTVNVTLSEDAQALDEVVVIGYGTTNRRDVLGSIASVKQDEIIQTTPVNAFDAIQGRMSGVQIASNGGPGSGSDIKIRGTSTFSGGVNPLYVVDGQQLDDIDNLNPNDIQSIEVLKDGASAAIYGSKSANGVVIVTTKKGKSGDPKLNVSHSSALSFVNSLIPVSNTKQWYKWQQLRTGNSQVQSDSDSLSLANFLIIDIQDEIIKPATRNEVNVAFSGGGEKNRFYWNTGYLEEEGVVLSSGYKRVSTTMNVDFDFNKYISAGTKLSGSYELRDGLSEGGTFLAMARRPPNLLVQDFDGSYLPDVFARDNPVAEALFARRDTRDFRGTSFNYIELNLLPSLKFKSTLGINFRLAKNNNFSPAITTRNGSPGNGTERQTLSYDIQQENYFNYTQKFNKHNISALLGMSTQKWHREFSQIDAVSFSSDLIETFNNVSELDISDTFTNANDHSLSSVFGRVSYNFDGKYLLAGTLRRDGSSRFGSGKQWGNFPSISAGWRVSQEGFMENIGAISDLKFRAGFAITGNERIGDYDALLLYSPGFLYNGINGLAPIQLSNPDLGWESTEQLNLGLDLALFNNRLKATVDAYRKTTDDLLYNVPIPEESGFGSVRTNVGSVENRGLEIVLSGSPIITDNFEWFSSFNISFNDNKVLELADEDGFETGEFKVEEGKPLGNIYGYNNLGVFQNDESNAFADNGQQLTANFDGSGTFEGYTLDGQAYSGTVNQLSATGKVLGGGDVIWEDLNGDFNIDAQNDRKTIGNGYPKYFGGFFNEFKYKGIALSFLFDYNFGNDIFKWYDLHRNTASNSVYTPSPDRIDDAWVQQGDVAGFPSLEASRTQNRIGIDSQYLSPADYIKLRNVKVGYSLPKKLMNKIEWMDSFSLSLTLNNLITWTNYEGYNPELGSRGNPLQPGIDRLRYPNKTDVILGLNIQL